MKDRASNIETIARQREQFKELEQYLQDKPWREHPYFQKLQDEHLHVIKGGKPYLFNRSSIIEQIAKETFKQTL